MKCNPNDIALKSFFLGPQAENGEQVKVLINNILERWFSWRQRLYPQDGRAVTSADHSTEEFINRELDLARHLGDLLTRFEVEVPKFSPRYIGHMFSEFSIPALLGHLVALIHNPNNISGESSRIGVEIENEAIIALCALMGYSPSQALGHFTSGGTVANYEAMIRAKARCARWLATGAAAHSFTPDADLFKSAHMGWSSYDAIRERLDGPAATLRFDFLSANPWAAAGELERTFQTAFRGPVVLIPESKHYSWQKGVSLLGLGEEAFWPIPLDRHGKVSVPALEKLIRKARAEQRPVMLVVSVSGTTELGQIDPIDRVQELLDKLRENEGLHIWHHVDAAFGGFFRGMGSDDQYRLLSTSSQSALSAISGANSVTLDPHKLGYVPYASGAILIRSAQDYRIQSFDSAAPYVQFNPARDRGPYSIEGSRSAAGAVATWLTARTLGFNGQGLGRVLSRTIEIKQQLEAKLARSGLPVRIAPSSDTNILCFTFVHEGERVSVANSRAERIFERLSPEGDQKFFVSKTSLSWKSYGTYLDGFVRQWNAKLDTEKLVLLRTCLMNPFFSSIETDTCFMDEFIETLRQLVAEEVL